MKGKIKTILVDNSEEVVNSLEEYFNNTSSIEVVKSFKNGKDALEYILSSSQCFDLIIMDILLPEIDGTTILEKMKEDGIKKNVIILSGYKDEKVIRKCMDYNVTHYMLKPVNILALENRIFESYEEGMGENLITSRRRIDLEVSKILHHLGIPTHIRGYKYIRDSILLIYNNSEYGSVTKEIYPKIARKYETTSSRVERAIRHAIEVSCTRGDVNLIEEIFGFSVSFEKSRPTNAEFITTLADRFRIDKSFGKNLVKA